jgi:hypothetical protein
MIDRKRLIGEVAARHGVRLEEDAPAFLLVTLAELAMKDAQAEFLAAVRLSTAEHEESAERIQKRIGESLAKAVIGGFRTGAASGSPQRLPLALIPMICFGLLAGLTLFGAGFVFGGGCR